MPFDNYYNSLTVADDVSKEEKKTGFDAYYKTLAEKKPPLIPTDRAMSRKELADLGVTEKTNLRQRKIITDAIRRKLPSMTYTSGGAPMPVIAPLSEATIKDIKEAPGQIPKQLVGGTEEMIGTIGDLAAWVVNQPNFMPQQAFQEYMLKKLGPEKLKKYPRKMLIKQVENYGGKWKDWWQEQANKGWEAPDPEIMNAKWGERPVTKAVGTVARAAPNYLTAIAASILTKNPQTGLLFISGMSGASAYGKQIEKGTKKPLANAIALGTAAWEYVTEKVPFEYVLKGNKSLLKKLIVAPNLEAAQELVQGLGENFLEYFGYNLKDLKSIPAAAREGVNHMLDNWVDNVVGGYGLGLLGAGVTGRKGIGPDPTEAIGAPVAPVEPRTPVGPTQTTPEAEMKSEPVELPFEKPTIKRIKQAAERSYQHYVNRFASIENVVKKAQKLGAKVKAGENPALRARCYLGLGHKVGSTLERNTFRINPKGEIEITGEGLKPILDDFDKQAKAIEKKRSVREKDFENYLIAQRTILDLQRPPYEGAKQNIVSEKQVTEAESSLEKIKSKYGEKGLEIIKSSARRLYEFQSRILHLLVDSGNLSEKQYNEILSQNRHYIPFDRILDDIIGGVTSKTKKGFTGARAPIKKIRGDERQVQPVIESVIKNTYRIIDVAERNTIDRCVAKLADILPDEISPVQIKSVPVRLTKAEAGVEKLIFRASAFKPRGRVIEYFDNGKRKGMELAPNLYEAMSGLSETSASLLTRVFSKPAHWLRVGATITPEFMVRNPIRDQYTALMQTSFGFIPFVDPAGAIADILGKKEVYHDWMRSGGAYAGFVELNRPALKKAHAALKDLRGRKLLKNLNVIADAQDISLLFEQATRLAVFKAAKKKGLTAVEAGFESREATVDFARRGSQLRDVNQVIAFFNAGIQGFDKTVRNSIKNPGSTAMKALLVITLPSLLLYLRNRKEPEYKELPRWQKDFFWCFKVAGIWVRYPKPFLYGQVFGSLPERFMEYIDKKDPKAFKDLWKSIKDSVLPVSGDIEAGLLPTAIKPIIENSVNYNFFMERPIVPEGKKRVLPSEQYGRYTSESAKQLGKWINYSPSKIENLIRGYFGGTGRYGLEGGDMLLNAINKAKGVPAKPERPRQLADVPLIKGFVSRPPLSISESVNQFYDDYEKLMAAHNTYRLLNKRNQKAEAEKVKNKYPALVLSKTLQKAATALSELNKKADKITESTTLTQEQKRQKIHEIDTRRVLIAKTVNEKITEVQKMAKK